jgi:CBS domain-containing protein
MRTVSDAMNEPLLLEASMTLQEASALMLEAGVEAAVIVCDGSLFGLLTANDVAQALLDGREPSRTPTAAIANDRPPLATADEPLAEVHQRLRGAERRYAVVLSRGQEPVGLLSDHEAAA